jgi:thioredoxin 1
MRFHFSRKHCSIVFLLAAGSMVPLGLGQAANSGEVIAFSPLDRWKSAVSSGDTVALRALYSATPPATISAPGGDIDADADVAFWTALKVRRLKVEVLQSSSPQPGLEQVVLQAEVHSASPSAQTVYINAAQLWQRQGGEWRMVTVKRTQPAHLQQPTSTAKQIYPTGTDARAEIKHALEQASKGHKRVLVVFGANWCYDCHVLDLAFHRPDLAPVLERGYEVVHVDVGRGDKNQDLMNEYQVPMKRGIPALAVLDGDGRLLFSQKTGEFENARSLAPQDLLQFLNQWKPQAR